jgi:hypothetical protein
LLLLDAVHRRNENRQLVLGHVLKFVNEDRLGYASGLRCATDLLKNSQVIAIFGGLF